MEIVQNLVFLPLPTLGPWLEHWVGRYQGNLEKDRELPEGWMASQWLVKDGELPKGWMASQGLEKDGKLPKGWTASHMT